MTTLTLGQALRNAVEAERAAQRFYALLAESTDDPGAKAFLEDMAAQEAQHAAMLETAAAELNPTHMARKPDGNVELIETAPEWAFQDNLSLEQALAMALDMENHAALYYDALSDQCTGETSNFFSRLSRTEDEHARAVRKRMKTR